MLRDVKEFALKGNLLELAVAFVLGLAIPIGASTCAFCTKDVQPAT